MPQAARLFDETIGVCEQHGPQTGYILTASEDVFADGIERARFSDTVIANCGHTGILLVCSETVLLDNLPAARVGDEFVGIYTGIVLLGSNTVFTG